METFNISSYENEKRHLGKFPVVRGAYTSQKIHSKSIFGFILRSQPTLYDRWFTRYKESCNFVIIRSQNTKNCILGALPVA